MATNTTSSIISLLKGMSPFTTSSQSDLSNASECSESQSQTPGCLHGSLDSELASLLQFESRPVDDICYLRLSQKTNWSDFIHDMPSCLHAWKECSQCEKTWNEISTLANKHGDPIIFSESIRNYPAWSHRAISKFKSTFRSLKHSIDHFYNAEIVTMPKNKSYNSLPNFGQEATPGHNHIFLCSNFKKNKLTDRDPIICNKIIYDSLRIIEKKLSHLHMTDDIADYFDQTTMANYWCDRQENQVKLVEFLKSVSGQIRALRLNPRDSNEMQNAMARIRPILIVNLAILMERYDCSDDRQLQDAMALLMRTFRARSNVFLQNPRLTIVFNFVLNKQADKSTFLWPKNSSLKERIVACLLRNALYKGRDIDVVKKIMVADNLSEAIKIFEDGGDILLNDNQTRLQILLNVLTQPRVPTTIKVSVVEELMINFAQNYILEDIVFPRVSGYYGYSSSGENKAEIIHNAIIRFTSHKN